MPIRNGSGHDVEYDVEEGEPPPGPGLVEVPESAMFASMAFTFGGTGFVMLGCLAEFGSPLLAGIGTAAIGIALGIQGFAVAAGRRRRRAPRRLFLSSGGGKKPGLTPGQTVPYVFNPGDRVVYCWVDDEGPKSIGSASVMDPGALVELIELGGTSLRPGGDTHAVLIHS